MEDIKEIDIIITLVAGTLVVFIMSVVIVTSVIKYQKNVLKQKELLREAENKFQNELLDATITASEKERETVAKNIHDDIGALINVIKLNNGQLNVSIQNGKPSSDLIRSNDKLLLEINENIRAIFNDLASPTLNRYGFVKALDQVCSQVPNSIKIDLETELEDLRFDKKTEMQLFRICKETLTNILKHSNSNEIHINITFEKNYLTVAFYYNGKGINDEEARNILDNNKGLGLKSIYSRIQILGGNINYYTNNMKDASIIIKTPIATYAK